MKTLVLGFKKYANHATNPSEEVLSLLKGKDIKTIALRPSYAEVAKIGEVLKEEKPDFVITINLSPFRKEPAIEEYAYNEMNSIQPDEDGVTKLGEAIIPDGPKSLNSPLDIASIRQYLVSQGSNVAVSIDPGYFFCNELSYLVRYSGIPSVSLHIPPEKECPLDEVKDILELLIAYFKATH